jgi:hypothetical protein
VNVIVDVVVVIVIVIVLLLIIIITTTVSFMLHIYTYIPETNHVPKE